LGADGDFYIDTSVSAIYGPKAGSWGSPTSLIGPAGSAGSQGIQGEIGPQGPAGQDGVTLDTVIDTLYPVGALYVSTLTTNPNTLLGRGTWSAFGAGRVLVGRDGADTDFDTAEETGGAKTVAAAGSNSAPTISGSTASESSHTHSVTSNVSVDNHSSHTHTYTEVPNHVHVQTLPSTQAGNYASGTRDTSAGGTGGSPGTVADALSTANPTGGVATGTTAGPSATLTHAVNNPAVTSGAGSSHSHGAGTLAASAPTFTGSPTSVVQPYIVVYMWKRTA